MSKKKEIGISGRPPKQFNVIFFNLLLNANCPEKVMMKIFGMSRGTFYRYKKKLYYKINFTPLPVDELLMEEQRTLFDKYAYKIVDNYSQRLWGGEKYKDDYKQECLLKIWSNLGKRAIDGFIAYCNRICESVLKDTIYKIAYEKEHILHYEDYYFDNSNNNKLDKFFSIEEEYNA